MLDGMNFLKGIGVYKSEDCQNKNNVAACCFLMWWNFVKRDKWLYVVIGMP